MAVSIERQRWVQRALAALASLGDASTAAEVAEEAHTGTSYGVAEITQALADMVTEGWLTEDGGDYSIVAPA